MFWVKHPQRKILSVYVPVANAIWQPHDLHLIWKSAWEWAGTAHALQAAELPTIQKETVMTVQEMMKMTMIGIIPRKIKKVKRLRREKGANSPRNRRAGRIKNGVAGHANAANGPTSSQESLESLPEVPVPNYENMTIEDRKALLLSTCGVISEHTKKMCTRSVRCPQHTDEQRRQVRHFLLRQNRHAPDIEDVHIDIDTCDDAETQSLRESLQWEASSNSSPADSTSTNNSTTSTNKRPAKNSKPGGGSKNKKQKMPSNKSNSSASSKDSASTSLYDFTS
ncbi:ataxin-7-like protein 3 isoform X4 [Pomacea canaliculata]|uniref:ataxin-7-like protein 3 isoform X4 n=1 Tax=Pomacea canaliculata TaxID=400727 RepID=UPI000D73D94F|nr:ataxin-7-like protein 3 isoform X4 [Pomacea canaliculata]